MNTKGIANFFFEVASLRRIIRSHSQFIHAAGDNIADHSFRVTVIGMMLANLEDCDENKVLKMCLFHDLAEARIGDANFVNKLYSDLHEEQARKDQMNDLPIGDEVLELLHEYELRESKESLVAKDADLLDQMILQQEYLVNDKVNLKAWQTHTQMSLKTESAKKLASEIRETNPFEWLYALAEGKTEEKVER